MRGQQVVTPERGDGRQLHPSQSILTCTSLWTDAPLPPCRSIGDADLKGQGVTAVAEVSELALLTGRDAFVIVASDGLWDRLSNEDAVALVQDTVKHPGMAAQVGRCAKGRVGGSS